MNFAAAANSSDQYRCHVVRAIKTSGKRPLKNVAEAQKILEKVHDLCKPIMIKYKWKVQLLTEFFPKDTHLLGLNVNKGAKICVRLRPASNRDAFLPYNSIVGTFLHELTHMKIGPHNASFYKLLDQLWTECETIMDNNDFQNKFKNNMFNPRSGNGSSGSGAGNSVFAGTGHRLNNNNNIVRPLKNKRQALAAAALKRAKYNNLLGSNKSGTKLGGGLLGSSDVCSPGSLRRRMLNAAERRRLDSMSCGNSIDNSINIDDNSNNTNNNNAGKSSSIQSSIDVLVANNNKKKEAKKTGGMKRERNDNNEVANKPNGKKSKVIKARSEPIVTFTCHLCTFVNNNSKTNICIMCNTKQRTSNGHTLRMGNVSSATISTTTTTTTTTTTSTTTTSTEKNVNSKNHNDVIDLT